MDADGEIVRRHLLVTGLVQGVFFRASAQEQARMRAIAGWVRNRPDGTVEAEVEGRADAVDSLIDWMLRGGPAHARVDSLLIDEREVLGEHDFAIR